MRPHLEASAERGGITSQDITKVMPQNRNRKIVVLLASYGVNIGYFDGFRGNAGERREGVLAYIEPASRRGDEEKRKIDRFKIKLLRAYGGCLGAMSRRRTR